MKKTIKLLIVLRYIVIILEWKLSRLEIFLLLLGSFFWDIHFLIVCAQQSSTDRQIDHTTSSSDFNKSQKGNLNKKNIYMQKSNKT